MLNDQLFLHFISNALDQWFSTWGLRPTGGAWRMKTLWNNFSGKAKWKGTC